MCIALKCLVVLFFPFFLDKKRYLFNVFNRETVIIRKNGNLSWMNLDPNKIMLLQFPTIEESLRVLREGLTKRKAFIIVGLCNAKYQGRASSNLKDGERIVMIKSDGNVLIHRSTGLEPVNYMQSSCFFTTTIDKDNLIIKILQSKLKERLDIVFKKIFVIAALRLFDKGKFSLYASEEDMQRAVLANPSLIEAGFRPIQYEKRVKPGFIDVYGVDSKKRFVVVEIKRKIADKDAVMQLAKYLEVVRGDQDKRVRGLLAAPKIAKGVQKLMASLNIEFKPLNPKKCAQLLNKVRHNERLEYFFKSYY